MKTEETIEKDQNRQMPGVNEKKKKLKTGILLLAKINSQPGITHHAYFFHVFEDFLNNSDTRIDIQELLLYSVNTDSNNDFIENLFDKI